MNILGIDTSAKTVSVAVGNDSMILAEASATGKLTHSQTLMPLLEAVLRAANLTLGEVDCFAVSAGPGSFTGLRIGISACKGIAYGAGKPCVAVSALRALSLNLCGVEGIVCAAMDARCSQVYTALFDSTPSISVRRTGDAALTLIELKKMLETVKKNVFLVGDGAQLCYNTFKDAHAGLYLAGENVRYQRAASVILAAREKLAEEGTTDAAGLLPVYLRLPQVERDLARKKAEETNG